MVLPHHDLLLQVFLKKSSSPLYLLILAGTVTPEALFESSASVSQQENLPMDVSYVSLFLPRL
jgi:hypothetical protein